MLIAFDCPQCQRELEVSAEHSGTTGSCPGCGAAVAIPLPEVGPGATLGNFRIEKSIGKGGMGEVFLARQVSVDRPVALKVLPPRVTREPRLVERFLHEARITARLEHPNIVTAFEAGEDTGFYFLAMSFVDGESLADRVKASGAVSEKEALPIARQVAEGLDYAWDEFQILHRDVKPANIMLDRKGRVKLMDMGISKRAGEDLDMTVTGMVVGTPNYISPEQARNVEKLDFRADLYSLGATLYHVVTGTRPYKGSSAVDLMVQHANAPLPPPQERNPGLSDACSALLEIMMAKRPDQRHGSWRALIADIDRVLAGEMPATPLPLGDSCPAWETPKTNGTAIAVPPPQENETAVPRPDEEKSPALAVEKPIAIKPRAPRGGGRESGNEAMGAEEKSDEKPLITKTNTQQNQSGIRVLWRETGKSGDAAGANADPEISPNLLPDKVEAPPVITEIQPKLIHVIGPYVRLGFWILLCGALAALWSGMGRPGPGDVLRLLLGGLGR